MFLWTRLRVSSIEYKKLDYTADLGLGKAAGSGGQCNATSGIEIMVNSWPGSQGGIYVSYIINKNRM